MTQFAVLILLPLLSGLLCFILPGISRWVMTITASVIPLVVLQLALLVTQQGPTSVAVGGWEVPLGIRLYADGLSVLMLLMTAVVGLAVSLYSLCYFDRQTFSRDWSALWLILWSGLNALFLSADVFNVYVTLELMGLAAVALVALEQQAVAAALRYLFVSLFASLFYLLGVGLLYAQYGTLDMAMLADLMQTDSLSWMAVALISAALMFKTALFPLHFWLPPAHAGAPAPVSAVLSALVITASFYLLLRLWFGAFDGLLTPALGQALGVLGAVAVIWGSVQALRAERLKLIIAHSTVAQVGYLFLIFPFANSNVAASIAWHGGVWLALAHGLAKSAFFLAAGCIVHSIGHDRVKELAGSAKYFPVTLFAIGMACTSLIGLPPSGGFLGKWLLLNAAFQDGQWWWVPIPVVGGVLAGAYSFRILLHTFRDNQQAKIPHKPPLLMEWTAFSLAALAILLGVFSATPLALLSNGAAVGSLQLLEIPK